MIPLFWHKPPDMPVDSHKACILKIIVMDSIYPNAETKPIKVSNGIAFWHNDQWIRPMNGSKLPDAYKVTHWTYLDDIEDPEDY